MKKLRTELVLIMVLLAALAGCGRVKYPKYYTLNVPPPPDPVAEESPRTSVAVREFQSPVYLRQGPIVYRTTPEQIGFYEYHRWATDPRVLVTSAIIDHLRASGQFSAVSTYNGHPESDYIVSGKLEKLEELDYQSRVEVEVAMSVQITRVATGATVWSNAVSEVGTVSQRSLPGVVSQMNRTMELAINKLLSTIPTSLAGDKQLAADKH
jgi:ABC-type uncharacterized transport system auxiliary subunit